MDRRVFLKCSASAAATVLLSSVATADELFNENKDKIVRTSENNEISEKNIVMFLYKQLRLGNLEPKYIPDEYRDKIAALLKEEKIIKQKQIKEINQKIHNY